MAARSSYPIYASPLLGVSRPTPKKRSAEVPRRAATAVQHSGLLLSTGFEYTPRERAIPKAPDSFVNPLAAPLIFPALQTSEEVKMDALSFPFESPDPVALAEISESASAETTPTVHEHIPSLQEAYGMLGIEELRAREVAIAPDPNLTIENDSETAIAEDEIKLERKSIEEVAFGPQSLPVDATQEKKTPANMLEFFGLQQQPFDVTPDPAFLYLSPSHREALTTLKQGIEHFRGFMMLVAEPGMGKTTLLHKLMEELTESARVVFLFQTQCSSRELLCFILNELEVDHTGMDVVAMHRALNQALLEEMLRGRRFVLVVDEAQNLQEPVLETIRLLSDFETTHSKLIQIVLAGQPQIAETLMKPSLVQLRQRIAALANLKSLTPSETAAYIEHRLRAAGWSDKMIFSSDALDQIAESSAGVPRSINNLCFNALLEAFHRGLDVVEAEIVKEVSEKLNLESLVRPSQTDSDSQPSAVPEAIGATQLARALAAAFSAESRPDTNSENFIGPKPRPAVVLAGNLSEKVRSQSWSKHHEYRILVSLERDPVSGIPVAERYYCCSLYVDEAQAAGLKPGKPVRIKIEQE